MEERQLKRLLIIVAVSIAIIMGFKMMLTDSLTTMNQAAAKKKLATPAPAQPAIEPPALLEPLHFPPQPAEPPTEQVEMSPASADSDGMMESKTTDAPASTDESRDR